MHKSGKFVAVLVVLCGVGAAVLTSKLVQVRNSYTVKSEALKKKYSDTVPKVEELEKRVTALRNEIFRSRELWGEFWHGVPTTVGRDGTLQLGLGAQNIRDGLVLHGFELAPDGSSIYRGSFLTTDVSNTQSYAKPNWRATPEEVATWQSGNWRWRNALPSGYQDNFDKQLTNILKLEETLNDRQLTLEGQKTRLNDANAALRMREEELVGGDGLSRDPNVEPEKRDGLVPTVEKVEEARNHTLEKIDELRRKVRKVQADIEQAQAENLELVKKLPKPANQITQK